MRILSATAYKIVFLDTPIQCRSFVLGGVKVIGYAEAPKQNSSKKNMNKRFYRCFPTADGKMICQYWNGKYTPPFPITKAV